MSRFLMLCLFWLEGCSYLATFAFSERNITLEGGRNGQRKKPDHKFETGSLQDFLIIENTAFVWLGGVIVISEAFPFIDIVSVLLYKVKCKITGL